MLQNYKISGDLVISQVVQNLSGGGIREVVIPADYAGGSPIELNGTIKTITNYYQGAAFILNEARIAQLNLNAGAEVTGTGTITTADVSADAGKGTRCSV